MADVFTRIAGANLRPVSLWPARIPPRLKVLKWTIYSLRGYAPYGRDELSVRNGFEVGWAWPVKGGCATGGFVRTNQRGLYRALGQTRSGLQPPARYVTLGGRKVLEFRPDDTRTYYALGTGRGIYVFERHDGPSESLKSIASMIASLRPMSQISPRS
jgi:hypothetical protein